MTAEQYVRDLGKFLKCRSAKKREIKKQVLSEINDAVAKGEPLDEVLGRMGIAWEYAQRFNDTFGKAEWKAAKREKRLKIWAVVLLVIALIVVAVYQYLPKWIDISETPFEEQEVQELATELATLYGEENFEAVVSYFNEDMRGYIGTLTLQNAKMNLSENFGAVVSMGEVEVSTAKQGGELYAMAQVTVDYENITVGYTMTFDEDMLLSGFYISDLKN